MPRRCFGLCMALLAALFLISFSPGAMSAPGDVSVFEVSDDMTLNAGKSVSFEWVAYNDGTDRLLVIPDLRSSVPDRLVWSLEPSYAALEAGGGRTFYLNISANPDMYSDRITLDLVFDIIDMVTLESAEVTHQVSLRTVSAFGDLDRENKVLGIWDNFLPAPLDDNWGAFSVSIVIWLAIGFFVLKVAGPTFRRLTSRTGTKWDDIVLEVIRLPLALLLVSYGTVSSLEILSLPPATVADLELAYMVALTLIASLLAYRLLVKVVVCYGRDRCSDGKSDAGDVLVNAVSLLGKVIVPTAALFVIAGLFGVDLGNMILGVGFLGLVIGYATRNTLGNLFAGLQLLFDRPFRPGDRVPLSDGHTGQVLEVGLVSTKLLDMDTFEEVIIPNSLLESQVIVNMNAPDLRWKSNVKVRVPSTLDPAMVEGLMMEASRRTTYILQGQSAPVVRLSEVKGGRMLLTIFIWIDDVANRHLARTEYRRNLVRVFEERGVEFALPRMTVWLNRQPRPPAN